MRVKTQTKEQVDAGYEACRYALNSIMAMAALIGVWGLSCLISGLATNGIGGLLRGWWTAVTGS